MRFAICNYNRPPSTVDVVNYNDVILRLWLSVREQRGNDQWSRCVPLAATATGRWAVWRGPRRRLSPYSNIFLWI